MRDCRPVQVQAATSFILTTLRKLAGLPLT
jgi:hypothetical protein